MRSRGVAINMHAYASTFDVHRTRRVAGSVPVTCVCSIGVVSVCSFVSVGKQKV